MKSKQDPRLTQLAEDLKHKRVSLKEYEQRINAILGMNFQDRTEEIENEDAEPDRDGQES
jgi:hypothetical protein